MAIDYTHPKRHTHWFAEHLSGTIVQTSDIRLCDAEQCKPHTLTDGAATVLTKDNPVTVIPGYTSRGARLLQQAMRQHPSEPIVEQR